MPTGTVRLHRVLSTKPEKIYCAFLDPAALAKWLPPHGFTCIVQQMEARVGGSFKMVFHNFSSGNGHSFCGTYLEMVPHTLIRYTDKFDDPGLPGEVLVEVRIEPVSCGAQLSIVQSGLPEAIPVERCYLGWQQSLAQLAALVEPDIPG